MTGAKPETLKAPVVLILHGSGGGAAPSHAALYPPEAQVDAMWHGEATITWTEYDWWRNIIQAGIIPGLSSLPILCVRNALRSRGRCIPVNSEVGALP